MQSLPKISIIIPVYNVEPYIAECIQSVMRQTYFGEIECILIDDCGTDKSVEIAKQLINAYNDEMSCERGSHNELHSLNDRITFRILHHEHNRGLSAARNTGTDVATGDYIYYLDSDDYISDDCIEVLTQPLQEYGYDMVVGEINALGSGRYSSHLLQTCQLLSPNEIVSEYYVKSRIYHAACNKLIKRDLFLSNDLTFLEGQLDEDTLWTYKCCLCIHTLYVQNHKTYNYRTRADSIIGTHTKNISKHIQSSYQTADYVLSHPINADADLWNYVAARFLKNYVVLTGGMSKYQDEYLSLRKKLNFRPLIAWIRGNITLSDLKHFFFLVLPPRFGYYSIKTRYANNRSHL